MNFKREEIILGYVVDFFFPVANVIVEVDGAGYHDPNKDALRDGVLRANWYQVIRFSASEVINAPKSVVAQIATLVEPLQKQHRDRQRRTRAARAGNGSGAAGLNARELRQKTRTFNRSQKERERDSHYDQKRRARSAQLVQSPSTRKSKFRCNACKREFVTGSSPWPQCRKCPGSPAAERICSNGKCGRPLPADTANRYCHRCHLSSQEIRDTFGGGLSEYWKSGRHTRGT
jgi:hypothetical protein